MVPGGAREHLHRTVRAPRRRTVVINGLDDRLRHQGDGKGAITQETLGSPLIHG
ncbi:hypothetical protein [Streptomyces sp. NPDC058398]|uniref:hypothetical protein n=1 Tax=Streptomyces sp. NPDC058398 TaxID=3346479 RepID=UPI0034E728E9